MKVHVRNVVIPEVFVMFNILKICEASCFAIKLKRVAISFYNLIKYFLEMKMMKNSAYFDKRVFQEILLFV